MSEASRRLAVLIVVLWAPLHIGHTWYRLSDGTPLRWYCDEVPVFWDQALCDDVSPEEALQALRESLQTWNEVPCLHPRLIEGGGLQGVPPFQGESSGQRGTNLVIFESGDAWMTGNGKLPGVIALTTILYDLRSGAVGSFALEVNDGTFLFAVDGRKDAMDLQNTLTHEFGHVLALDHSQERCYGLDAPTMCYSAPAGETAKRTLAQDDREGLCLLYAQKWKEDGACVDPDANGDDSGGCIAGGRGATPGVPLMLLVALWMARRTGPRALSGRRERRIPG